MTENTPAPLPKPADQGQLRWNARSEILNWAYITYRYHRKRQWFFDLCDKVTQAASVIMGLAVFGKPVQDHLPALGITIASLGVLALVFGYADRKQCHREIADLARQLAGEIAAVLDAQLSDADLARWELRRTDIDVREPPNLKTLVEKCEWEQACAEGYPDLKQKPCWLRQLHMHFF